VDALADLLEQRHAGRFGELLDLHRDGGLRHVQLFSRARKTAEASHGFEHAQLRQRAVFEITADSGLRHIDSSLHQS
jgi:hypothetical protein